MNSCKIFDLHQYLRRQTAFTFKTFGPGRRTEGVVEHIREELDEILLDPDDMSEPIDVVILAFDLMIRAGKTPEEITSALDAKLTKNENRIWPDWRDFRQDQPINHVKGTHD